MLRVLASLVPLLALRADAAQTLRTLRLTAAGLHPVALFGEAEADGTVVLIVTAEGVSRLAELERPEPEPRLTDHAWSAVREGPMRWRLSAAVRAGERPRALFFGKVRLREPDSPREETFVYTATLAAVETIAAGDLHPGPTVTRERDGELVLERIRAYLLRVEPDKLEPRSHWRILERVGEGPLEERTRLGAAVRSEATGAVFEPEPPESDAGGVFFDRILARAPAGQPGFTAESVRLLYLEAPELGEEGRVLLRRDRVRVLRERGVWSIRLDPIKK